MHLKAPSRLTLAQLNRLLRNAECTFIQGPDGLWTEGSRQSEPLLLDLRLIKYADIKAIAALAIVARTIAGPDGFISITEPTDARAKMYLRNAGLYSALS